MLSLKQNERRDQPTNAYSSANVSHYALASKHIPCKQPVCTKRKNRCNSPCPGWWC